MSEAIEAPVAAPEPAATPAVESQTEGTTTETEGEDLPPNLPPAPPGLKYPKWELERVRKLTQNLRDMEARLAAHQQNEASARANGQPVQDNAPQQPPQDVEAVIAERRAGEEFNAKSNAIYQEGTAAHSDFAAKIQGIGQLGIPQKEYVEFLKDVIDLPNPTQVLYALGNDLDQAAYILGLPARKQALALGTLSVSLAADPAAPVQAAAPAIPPVPPVVTSRAPAPTRAIVGRSSSSSATDINDPKISMADFVRLREKSN